MPVFGMTRGTCRGMGAVVAAVLASGCGDSRLVEKPTVSVQGRVLLSSGMPLAAGRVVFVPSDGMGPSAAGEIGRDGAFRLTTRASDDGAAPGEYKVRIEPPPSTAPGAAIQSRGLAFPPKYLDEDSSQLVVVVQDGRGELDPIRLK